MSAGSEKPFEATPRRIARAIREGNVARASELAANFSFAAGGLSLAATAPLLGEAAGSALKSAALGSSSTSAVVSIFAVALIPIAASATAGVVANLIQSGGLIVVAVGPKAERINPLEGMKRILSRETVTHSLRSIMAFACAGVAATPVFTWCASALFRATGPAESAGIVWMAAREIAVVATIVGFVLSIAEYGTARGAWQRKLRMSFEERKRESKEEEGDAVARGRRRSLHRTLVRGGIARTKEATFVVANPSHVAVALEYRPPKVSIPRILVRAIDAGALRVRRIARECGVPIVENVWLARALYRDGCDGQPIPTAHYVAVAEVVASLMRLREIGR